MQGRLVPSIAYCYVYIITSLMSTGCQDNTVHIVIHDNLITGQNDESNLTAIQNLVLLYSQR